MNCLACDLEIRKINEVKSRCGHNFHNYCIKKQHNCVKCNKLILEKIVADEDGFPCHERCTQVKDRYYYDCPECGLKLSKYLILSMNETHAIIKELKDKTFEERLEIYIRYGFREDEVVEPTLSETDWEKIESIISQKNNDDYNYKPIVRPKIVIPPLKNYNPRPLLPGERYKPPSTRRISKTQALIGTLVPRRVKDRVRVIRKEYETSVFPSPTD